MPKNKRLRTFQLLISHFEEWQILEPPNHITITSQTCGYPPISQHGTSRFAQYQDAFSVLKKSNEKKSNTGDRLKSRTTSSIPASINLCRISPSECKATTAWVNFPHANSKLNGEETFQLHPLLIH